MTSAQRPSRITVFAQPTCRTLEVNGATTDPPLCESEGALESLKSGPGPEPISQIAIPTSARRRAPATILQRVVKIKLYGSVDFIIEIETIPSS